MGKKQTQEQGTVEKAKLALIEFFTELAAAIKAGSSQAQRLATLIDQAVQAKVIVNVARTDDGKAKLDESQKAVPYVTVTAKAKYGFDTSRQLSLAVWDFYTSCSIAFGDAIAKEAALEIKSNIQTASRLVASRWGLEQLPKADDVKFFLTSKMEPLDIAKALRDHFTAQVVAEVARIINAPAEVVAS
jgi:hypothetical protein